MGIVELLVYGAVVLVFLVVFAAIVVAMGLTYAPMLFRLFHIKTPHWFVRFERFRDRGWRFSRRGKRRRKS